MDIEQEKLKSIEKKYLLKTKRYDELASFAQIFSFTCAFTACLFLVTYSSSGAAWRGAVLALVLGMFSAVCFGVGRRLSVVAKKAKYSLGLIQAGLGETDALETVEREYSLGQVGQRGIQLIEGHYRKNKSEIDDFRKKYQDILVEKYHVRRDWLALQEAADEADFPAIETAWHLEKKSPEQVAEDMYRQLCGSRGRKRFNETIFRITPQEKKQQQKVTAVLGFALILFLVSFLNNSRDYHTYIISDDWSVIIKWLSFLITVWVAVWLKKRVKSAREATLLKHQSLTANVFASVFICLMSFLFLYFSVFLFYGSVITELTGQATVEAISVTKNHNIIRSSRRGPSYKYCVMGEGFNSQFNEYCIDEEAYNLLPETGTINFQAKKSFFGTVLKGYTVPAQ